MISITDYCYIVIYYPVKLMGPEKSRTGGAIDAHRVGWRGRGKGAPHVPPIKILKNFHIKMQ
jgi:hypothetical protein